MNIIRERYMLYVLLGCFADKSKTRFCFYGMLGMLPVEILVGNSGGLVVCSSVTLLCVLKVGCPHTLDKMQVAQIA